MKMGSLDSPYMEQTSAQGLGRNAGNPAPPHRSGHGMGARSYLVAL